MKQNVFQSVIEVDDAHVEGSKSNDGKVSSRGYYCSPTSLLWWQTFVHSVNDSIFEQTSVIKCSSFVYISLCASVCGATKTVTRR